MINFSKASFLSTTLIASLMVGASSPSIANANSLAAQGSWSVSKMNGGDGVDAYCAMARKFDKNIILTMAENSNNEISLAVDFQSPALRKTRDYTVVLSSGAGEKRTFSILPVSNKAFVVRLGDDKAFVSAMKSSGELSVSIDDKEYSFSTDKINSAFSDMEECLVAIGGSNVIDVTPSIPRAVKIKSEPIDNSKIASLENNIATLKAENKRLVSNLSKVHVDLEKSRKLKSDKVHRNNQEIEALISAQKQLQKSLAYSDNEREVLSLSLVKANKQISFMKSSPENARKQAELKEKISQLELELEDALTKEQARTLEYSKHKSSSVTKNQELVALNIELQKQIDASKSQYKDLSGTYNQLKENNSALAEEKAQEIVVLKNKIDSLEKKKFDLINAQNNVANETKKTVDDISNSLSEAIAKRDDLEKKVVSLEGELRESNVSFDNDSKENDLLFKDLNDKIVELEQKKIEETAKLDNLKKENFGLIEKQSDGLVEDKELITSLEKAIEKLRGENNALLANLEETKEELLPIENISEETNAYENKIVELEEQIKEFRGRNSVLSTDISIANAKVEASINIENDKLSKQDESDLRAKIRRLENDLEKAFDKIDIARVKLEKTVISYENKMMAKADPDSEIQSTLRRLQEAEREIRRLAHRMEEERSVHKQEKKDLEYMLFDPDLASSAQVSFLNSLEDMLEISNNQISKHKSTIKERNITIKNLEEEQARQAALIEANSTSISKSIFEKIMPLKVAVVEKESLDEPLLPEIGGLAKQQNLDSSKPQSIINRNIVSRPVMAKKAYIPKFLDKAELKNILVSSNVNISGDVVFNSGDGNKVSHSWNYDGIFGKAEQQVMAKKSSFNGYVTAYIQNINSKCPGEFAAVDNSVDGGMLKIESYEIACVSDKINSTVSALFMAKDGVFTVMSHETSSRRMMDAMDARDRIVAKVTTAGRGI